MLLLLTNTSHHYSPYRCFLLHSTAFQHCFNRRFKRIYPQLFVLFKSLDILSKLCRMAHLVRKIPHYPGKQMWFLWICYTKIDYLMRKKTNKNKSTSTREIACRGTRLAGIAGFEPTSDGVKVRCLTAWLYPNINKYRRH